MFTPHTDADREEMLRVIGVRKLDDLFADVPVAHRFPALDLPPAYTEMEALMQMEELAGANETAHDMACFLGAGAYYHYTPAAVDAIIRRGEETRLWVEKEPQVFQSRTVKIGAEQNGCIQIRDGLNQGETVVGRGAIFVDNEGRH